MRTKNPPPFNSPVRILGVRVDPLGKEDALSRLSMFLENPSRLYHVITMNALFILEARKNDALSKVIENASLCLPESAGVIAALRFLFGVKQPRLAGIDMARELLSLAEQKGWSVFLFGGKPGVAEEAALALKEELPNLNIAGHEHGFGPADDGALAEKIKKSGARIVLVALGMPGQDEWIYKNRAILPYALYVGVGGSFDVWAGRLKRAPKTFQSVGLEWLYRLWQEPTRWRRILKLPLFGILVCFQKLKISSAN